MLAISSGNYPDAFSSFFKQTSDVQDILMLATAYIDTMVDYTWHANSYLTQLQHYLGPSADIEREHYYRNQSWSEHNKRLLTSSL